MGAGGCGVPRGAGEDGRGLGAGGEFGRGWGCRTGGTWGRFVKCHRRSDLRSRPRCGFCQKIEVKGIIAILEECTLPTIAPLRYMVRNAGKNDAGQARHGDWISIWVFSKVSP